MKKFLTWLKRLFKRTPNLKLVPNMKVKSSKELEAALARRKKLKQKGKWEG